MKLQEAITHLEESLNKKNFSCPECRQEHEELLGYLKELKALRKVEQSIADAKRFGDIEDVEGYEGLKPKYLVFKRSTGEIVDGCFVLRPDKDMSAVVALSAYAMSCMDKNPQLGLDICQWLMNISKKLEEGNK